MICFCYTSRAVALPQTSLVKQKVGRKEVKSKCLEDTEENVCTMVT
jgi:hypothetical protein